jgi:hypothetical protein
MRPGESINERRTDANGRRKILTMSCTINDSCSPASPLGTMFDPFNVLDRDVVLLVSMQSIDTQKSKQYLNHLVQSADQLGRKGIKLVLVTTRDSDTLWSAVKSAINETIPSVLKEKFLAFVQIPDVKGDVGFALGALVNSGGNSPQAVWPQGNWLFKDGWLVTKEIDPDNCGAFTTTDEFLAKAKDRAKLETVHSIKV